MINKKLKNHVSCEFNRSVDTRLCGLRDPFARVRVFHYFPPRLTTNPDLYQAPGTIICVDFLF